MKTVILLTSLTVLGTLAHGQCIPPKIPAEGGRTAIWPMSPGYTEGSAVDPPAYFSCANYANSPLPKRTCTAPAPTGTACYGNLDCSVYSTTAAASTCGVAGEAVTGGIRKFVDGLPGLGIANKNNLGQYIPVAQPDTLTYPGSDYYEIELGEYTEQMHTDLPPTRLRGYRQTNTGDPAVSVFNYLGPLIVAKKDRPVRIKFKNNLPVGEGGNLFLPTDTTYMGSGPGPNISGMVDDPQKPYCGTYPKPAGCYAENRATLHLHGGITPWISDGTPHQWITPAGDGTAYPKGVSVVNVPDMNGCDPTADDGCMTFYYTNQQSARLLFYHDHAWGITRLNVYAGEAAGYLIRDDTEKALVEQGIIPGLNPADEIPLIIQDKTFVPKDDQLRTTDPLWEKAKWGGEGNLWVSHVYMPAQNPGDSSGVNAFGRWMYGPWFWPPTNDITNLPMANPYYDPACNPSEAGWCEPPLMPATPYLSSGMEAFNDTPVINGTAYPTLTVEPKQYRFRILNAANDRFFNLQMYIADPSTAKDPAIGATEVALNAAEVAAAQDDPVVVPTPDTAISPKGPAWIQIGTEGGFLPAPVVVPNQHITWVQDPTLFNVGNVDQHALLVGPAERADVIVDFSKFAGQTLILYNDAPAAFPARVATYDYYTGAPDLTDVGGAPAILPGYGPNTRTIMQIKVGGTPGTPAPDAYNPETLAKLQAAFAHKDDGSGVFESSQHPIIVGQEAYNSAYGTAFGGTKDGFARIADFSLNFNTLKGNLTMPLTNKAIHDEMGGTFDPEYGRMTGTLGVEVPNAKAFLQQFVNFPYTSPPTEIIDTTLLPKTDASGLKVEPITSASDGTQIWKVTHNGVDTHPIHFHLYDVQLLNRTGWDGFIRQPHPTELGWKETVRISPLEDTFVALRPVVPTVPFELPNSVRLLNPAMPEGALLASATLADAFLTGNIPMDPLGEPIDLYNHAVNFGYEYVWHCHILGHEEMDMMRSQVVGVMPKTPTSLAVVVEKGGATLTWLDNSANETGFTVQRASDPSFVAGLTSFTTPPNATTYIDNTIKNNTTYFYRVIADNVIGDTWAYSNPAINAGASFPTKNVMSAPSNTATLGTLPTAPAAPTNLVATLAAGPQVRLTWKDNSRDEAGFVVQRAMNGAAFVNLVTLPANATSYADTAVASPNSYTYRVSAINGGGSSAPSTEVSVTLGALPTAPTEVKAVVSSLKNSSATVTVSWRDNATNETGFRVKRATDVAFTQNAVTATVTESAGQGALKTYSENLKPGQTLYYCVQSFNANGSSPCILAIPSPTVIPTAPKSVLK